MSKLTWNAKKLKYYILNTTNMGLDLIIESGGIHIPDVVMVIANIMKAEKELKDNDNNDIKLTTNQREKLIDSICKEIQLQLIPYNEILKRLDNKYSPKFQIIKELSNKVREIYKLKLPHPTLEIKAVLNRYDWDYCNFAMELKEHLLLISLKALEWTQTVGRK